MGLSGGMLAILAGWTPIPVSVWMAILGGVALVAAVVLAKHRIIPGGPEFWIAVLVLLPFMLIAAAAPATMWDDFTHWLHVPAYLYRFDSLPRPSLPPTLSVLPGYPPTMPFLAVAASWLAGRFLENAGAVINLALCAAFAATLVGAIKESYPDRTFWSLWSRAAAVGVAVPFTTLLNPGFDRNVALSAYADVATAVVLATCGILGWLILKHLVEQRSAEARAVALQFALAAVALINLKQSNVGLLAFLLLGFGLVAWRSRIVPRTAMVRLLPTLLPAAVVYLFWRGYVSHNVPIGELTFKPVADWNFEHLPNALRTIAEYYIPSNPAFYLMMYGVTAIGLWRLIRPGEDADYLLSVTAVCWISYNALLLLVYLAVMTPYQADWAADYWRYSPHVGLLATAAIVIRMATAWPPAWSSASLRALALTALVAFPMVTAVAARTLSPWAKAWPIHSREVGRFVADRLPPSSRVVAINADGLDSMPFAIRYDLSRPGLDDRDLRLATLSAEDFEPLALERAFREGRATHLIVSGVLGPMDAYTAIGVPPIRSETLLLEWTGNGWHLMRSWHFDTYRRPTE
jgi:hypothetical protein